MTKAEKTRQFILEKSAPIFNVKGIAGTAMSDIMDATSMPKGTLYLHFASKDELACSAVDYNLSSLLGRIESAVQAQKTFKSKLIASFEYMATPRNAPIAGGCPMINFGMEADDTNPIVRKKVYKAAETIQNNIAALVEQGKTTGEFKKSWDGASFAVRSFVMLEGAIFLSRIAGNREKMKMIISLIKEEIEKNCE